MDLTPFKECKAHKNAIFIGNETPSDGSDNPALRPCCWFETRIGAGSYAEYQEKLAQVDIEKTCRYCIDMEKNGGTWSHRKFFESRNNKFTVSISFDNLCNLKCITCSPQNSSGLALEMVGPNKKQYTTLWKKEPIKSNFLKEMLSTMDIDELQLEILGGEPLINPAVYNFLDWLIEQPYAKQTTINVTTNGTTYDERIIKYIDNFKQLSVQVSIDGVNNVFEYIRFGNSFHTLRQVVDKFYVLKLTRKNFSMSMNYTLSWMNSLHISDFFNWVAINYPQINFILVTKLEWPEHYAISILPIETRKRIVDKVLSEVKHTSRGVETGLDFYKQHMLTTEQTIDLLTKAKQVLARNDKLPNRKSNFNETFAHILDFLNTI